MWIKLCKDTIKDHLQDLRSGKSSQWAWRFHQIREEVQNGDFSLPEIGTSEKELNELWIKYSKKETQDYLQDLRSGILPQYEALRLEFILNEDQRGTFSLENDIGTSKKELEELRIKLSSAEK